MTDLLFFRKATSKDLTRIIELIQEDEFTQKSQLLNQQSVERYKDIFQKIDKDSNQYLMVVELELHIVGTCHLYILPSLTLSGATRLQIESLHVAEKYRCKKIGERMIREAITYGQSKGASIVQLMTNKRRQRAKRFYERLGFEATHEGMKIYLEEGV